MAWILIIAVTIFGMGGPKPKSKHKPAASRPAASQPATSQPSSQSARVHVRGKATPLKDITKDMLKKTIIVEGEVLIVAEKPSRTKKKIYIHTITQGDELIEVVWWSDLAEKLSPDQKLKEGDKIRIRGKVSEYRKKLQIIPRRAEDIEVVKQQRRD